MSNRHIRGCYMDANINTHSFEPFWSLSQRLDFEIGQYCMNDPTFFKILKCLHNQVGKDYLPESVHVCMTVNGRYVEYVHVHTRYYFLKESLRQVVPKWSPVVPKVIKWSSISPQVVSNWSPTDLQPHTTHHIHLTKTMVIAGYNNNMFTSCLPMLIIGDHPLRPLRKLSSHAPSLHLLAPHS